MIGGDEAQIFPGGRPDFASIAQTCRQSGLSVVYAELFSFEGAAIHFHEAASLVGTPYGQALFRFPTATLIGLRYADGRVQINLLDGDHDPARRPGNRHRGTSWARRSILRPRRTTTLTLAAIRAELSAAPPLERLLILGWNRRGPLILEQLGLLHVPDSQVLVVAPGEPQADAGRGCGWPSRGGCRLPSSGATRSIVRPSSVWPQAGINSSSS